MFSLNVSWLRGVALVVAISFMSIMVMLSGVPAQAEDWVPVAPVSYDRCGTALDEYVVMDENSYYTLGSFDGPSVPEGEMISTNGALQVTIVAHHYSGASQAFPLAFTGSANDACAETQDTGAVAPLSCNPATGVSTVSLSYTNTADNTGFVRDDVQIFARRSDGATVYLLEQKNQHLAPIPDGQTASWTSTGYNQLGPGTHVVSFRKQSGGAVQFTRTLSVPACGAATPPPGDPLNGDDPTTPGGNASKPSASVQLVSCQMGRVNVTLNTKKVQPPRTVKFRVVKNPLVGKTVKMKPVKLAAGKTKPVKLQKLAKGTKLKVQYHQNKRWYKLATGLVPKLCGSTS